MVEVAVVVAEEDGERVSVSLKKSNRGAVTERIYSWTEGAAEEAGMSKAFSCALCDVEDIWD